MEIKSKSKTSRKVKKSSKRQAKEKGDKQPAIRDGNKVEPEPFFPQLPFNQQMPRPGIVKTHKLNEMGEKMLKDSMKLEKESRRVLQAYSTIINSNKWQEKKERENEVRELLPPMTPNLTLISTNFFNNSNDLNRIPKEMPEEDSELYYPVRTPSFYETRNNERDFSARSEKSNPGNVWLRPNSAIKYPEKSYEYVEDRCQMSVRDKLNEMRTNRTGLYKPISLESAVFLTHKFDYAVKRKPYKKQNHEGEKYFPFPRPIEASIQAAKVAESLQLIEALTSTKCRGLVEKRISDEYLLFQVPHNVRESIDTHAKDSSANTILRTDPMIAAANKRLLLKLKNTMVKSRFHQDLFW